MNMLDMHTREKANKIHLDEMHREAKSRSLLRNASPANNSASAISYKRLRVALVLIIVLILFGAFLLIFTGVF